MSLLINQSFFIRDLNLPNTGDAKILERITSFITKYEPECLKTILSYELYKAFQTEDSQRMTDLKSGVEYYDSCGKLKKWQGLVHDTDESLIAAYIYYHIQEASATQTTGVSTKVSKSEAATSVSPMDKMINAWNYYSSEVEDLLSFLWNKRSVYTEISIDHIYCVAALSRRINYFGI